jgi:hypothetical protein
MPIKKTSSGYKYGSTGKTYGSRTKAAKQGRAIKASQARKGKK